MLFTLKYIVKFTYIRLLTFSAKLLHNTFSCKSCCMFYVVINIRLNLTSQERLTLTNVNMFYITCAST